MISPEALKHAAQARGLEGLEHRVAAAIRGYVTLQDSEWVLLENTLLRLVLDAATLSEIDLPIPDGRHDLPLSLLCRALSCSARITSYQTNYFLSLAALAFASAANFSTASLVASQALSFPELSPFERWAMSVLSDRSLTLDREETPSVLRRYARLEQSAIRSGIELDFLRADRAFYSGAAEWSRFFNPVDAMLLLFWAQVRRRFKSLSASRILSSSGNIPSSYIGALLRTSSPLLYPTQAEAIERFDLLNPVRNALITLPTSTGKSLLGELAIVASITNERPLGVYLAPYRALADQIFRRMRTRLSQIGVTCEARRGGYLGDQPIDGESRTVLVATPEAFDAFLRLRPELRNKIACCVFDEFHLIEQPIRGLRYEGLLGRLKTGSSARIVSLSPVVQPSRQLLDWLSIEERHVIASAWRPTARRIAIARPNGRADYFTPGDHIDGDPQRPSWLGTVPFPHPIEAPIRSYAHELRIHDEAVATNVASVALDQHTRFKQPVLVLATTRDQTRTLAARISSGLSLLEEDDPARVLAIEIRKRCPYLHTLPSCLDYGVAYHNAALPNWIRERLEGLMSDQRLCIVSATTTLAEGVDLPFRVVVMADWRNWLYGQQRAMPTLLFRNIAGRCGRAGAFTEGDTVIVDNPGRRPEGPDFDARYEDYIRLYIRPQPQNLESSISQAVVANEDQSLKELNAALESQFIAYLDFAKPDEGQEESDFSASLFAAQFDGATSYVDSVTHAFVEENLGDVEFPVIQRHSPLALTDFGRGVLLTGLSPRSGVSLGRFLREYNGPSEPGVGRSVRRRHNIFWEPLIAGLHGAIENDNAFVAELTSGS